MGLETNAAALLLKIRRDDVPLGRVLTLGHQHLHLEPAAYRRVLARLGQPLTVEVPEYADSLFEALGATRPGTSSSTSSSMAARWSTCSTSPPRSETACRW